MIDSDKLYKKLLDMKELQHIPIIYIITVAIAVIELLNNEEILYTLSKEDIS